MKSLSREKPFSFTLVFALDVERANRCSSLKDNERFECSSPRDLSMNSIFGWFFAPRNHRREWSRALEPASAAFVRGLDEGLWQAISVDTSAQHRMASLERFATRVDDITRCGNRECGILSQTRRQGDRRQPPASTRMSSFAATEACRVDPVGFPGKRSEDPVGGPRNLAATALQRNPKMSPEETL